MELQGVKILRISDLRRFFDLSEFWRQKEEFVRTVTNRGERVFFDNDNEINIFRCLKAWLINRTEILSGFKGEKELILRINGKDEVFQLGRLAEKVFKYRKDIKQKDLVGLTILYLLLGANDSDDIELEYPLFAAIISGKKSIGDFVPCDNDTEFDFLSFPEYPLERRIIANMNTRKTIIISNGSDRQTLEPGECVVGLFHNELCWKLLPHSVVDNVNHVSMRLFFDKRNKKPCLEIQRQKKIRPDIFPDVCSITIERGGFPVFLTIEGRLCFDESRCFQLKRSYDIYRQHDSGNQLIAFSRDESYNYTFITTQTIHR